MAGVSIGTASQALNNRPNVAQDTRARVLDAARSLGYPMRDTAARSTDPGVEVIGMLTKHDFGLQPEVNPFYSHVQAGVESECRRQRISLMYSSIEVDPSNHPVMWPPMVSEQRVDGLLLVGTFIDDTVGMLKRRVDVPVVLVDSYAPGLPYDTVLIANHSAAVKAVEYLIANGHRYIGLVGTSPQSPPGVAERRAGYLDALAQHGIAEAYIEDSWLSSTDGYAATQRLLTRAPQITAIFASADLVATGVVRAAWDMGLHIPDDLSVMGFDNIDLAREMFPPLTTVNVHKTWMGVLGVQQLLQRVHFPDQPQTTVILDTELVIRDSVRQLAAQV